MRPEAGADSERRSLRWILLAYGAVTLVGAWLVWEWSYPSRYLGDDVLAEWIRRALASFFSYPHFGWPIGDAWLGLAVWTALLAPLLFYQRRAGRRLARVAVGYLAALDLLWLLPML